MIRLPLANGIARVDRGIAMETKEVGVAASGTLDLRDETLDFALKPRLRAGIQVKLVQFADLVRFRGPFTAPTVVVDAKGTAETIARLGAAYATGGLSVLGESLLASGAGGGECEAALGKTPPASAAKAAAAAGSSRRRRPTTSPSRWDASSIADPPIGSVLTSVKRRAGGRCNIPRNIMNRSLRRIVAWLGILGIALAQFVATAHACELGTAAGHERHPTAPSGAVAVVAGHCGDHASPSRCAVRESVRSALQRWRDARDGG